MNSLLEELSAAARGLAASPRFSALAVLCLGVGLGLAVAIFAVFRGVVLEPLPYPAPDRLRVVWNDLRAVGEPEVPLSGHEYLDLADQQEALAPVGVAIGNFFNLTDPGEPERLWGVRASASFFDTLRVEPVVGRGFAPDEDRFGAGTVVLLSHGLWQRRFGGSPDGADVVGTVLTLNGQPAEVIGVLPADFRFYDGRAELWVPVAMNLDALPPRGARGLLTVGRLAPGVSDEAADAEIEALGRRFQEAHPQVYPSGDGYRLRLESLTDQAVGPRVRTTLALLLAAAGLVLAIALANTVNLLVARSTVRAKEVALRLALGATRGRLAARFLAEGLLLASAAGVLGLFLAWGAVRLFVVLAPPDLPRLDDVTLGAEVLVPGLALAVGLGVVLALVPLVSRAGSAGDRLADSLREGGKTAEATGAGAWLRDALVVAEIAVAATVLLGAGLALARLSTEEPDAPWRTVVG